MNNKIKITTDTGEIVDAISPVIISASRSTDIPAFYCDWFFDRIQKGYSAWINPYNGLRHFISYSNMEFIVFWTKNPKPLLKYLYILDEMSVNYYIQYTLNDYEDEKLEKGVPSLDNRIETFIELSNKIGKDRVIWRFDPLILSDKLSVDVLLEKIKRIGDKIHKHTNKLVFSFADIKQYFRVENNLNRNGINYKEWDEDNMLLFAEKLSEMNKSWNLSLSTCSEKINLSVYGINKNKCIDDELIIKLSSENSKLMDFLNVQIKTKQITLFGDQYVPENAVDLGNNKYACISKNNKDSGQRYLCGCAKSKDIGEYHTCPHMCEYCYANSSKETAITNWKKHKENIFAETITGK